ncbi:MAG: hypothetical protein ACI9S9_002818, partial [Planctomycetota bacterium]
MSIRSNKPADQCKTNVHGWPIAMKTFDAGARSTSSCPGLTCSVHDAGKLTIVGNIVPAKAPDKRPPVLVNR